MINRTKTNSMGFTLVEMMMTLAIASILLGVVAPGMAALLDSNRLQTTTQNLFSAMMLTRSEALKRNREVIMCKSTDGAACATGTGTQWEQGWLVYVDANDDSTVDADEILRVDGPLSGDMTLRVAGAFSENITYGTDGSASGAGTFILCNKDADKSIAREVAVSLTGRPKMNKTTADCAP